MDADGDGHFAPPCGDDCDDADELVHPGASELGGDGVDGNCDGVDGVDVDGDGHAPERLGGDDCDDTRATVYPGANDGEGWRVEATGINGAYPWLRVDPWARPQAALGSHSHDCGGNDSGPGVTFQSLSAGDWTTEPVLDGPCVAAKRILLVRGRITVVVYAALQGSGLFGDIMVGVRQPSGWGVSSLQERASDIDATLDECGGVVVAYGWWNEASELEVKVRGPDPSLPDELVDRAPVFETSLARAPDGSTWIAYGVHRPYDPDHVDTESELRVATNGSGEWRIDSVDAPTCGDCLYHLDLEVDGEGSPHVAYATDLGLTYATREGRGWRRETVSDLPAAGAMLGVGSSTVTIRVGPDGTLHATYVGLVSDQETGLHSQVIYATKESGSWRTERVGPGVVDSFNNGLRPSMDVDAQGQVHILWFSWEDEPGSPFVDRGGRYAVLSRTNDGIDQNCDGVDGVDADGDGQASQATGGTDRDDNDSAR